MCMICDEIHKLEPTSTASPEARESARNFLVEAIVYGLVQAVAEGKVGQILGNISIRVSEADAEKIIMAATSAIGERLLLSMKLTKKIEEGIVALVPAQDRDKSPTKPTIH